jgi:hypothetical protein
LNTGGGGTSGANGTNNLGGGGGGAAGANVQNGGNGGSGVVILRYADTFADLTSISGGLTYSRTVTGGYKIYSFTAGTGSVTV